MQKVLDIPHLQTPMRRAKKAIPKLGRLVDQLRNLKGTKFPGWPDWCFLPWLVGMMLLQWNRHYGRYNGELGMMATWRVTQGVYRFDPDVYEDVISTPINRVPCEALYFLPEWAVFVPTPSMEDSPGFWARLEWGDGMRPDSLELLLLKPDGSTSGAALQLLPDLPLDEMIERTWVAEYEDNQQLAEETPEGKWSAHARGFVEAWKAPEFRRQEHDRLRSWVEPRLALLLYVCSKNKDISHPDNRLPANPAPKKTKKGMRHFPAQSVRQWEVGIRVGAALRQAREAADSASTRKGTGRRKRPHIRRAHWHSYWTGPRNGDRRLVLKWLPPIPINVEAVEDLPTTVRPVPAHEAA